MTWLTADIRRSVRDTRGPWRDRAIEIHDVAISTGAGMYLQSVESDTMYLRSGALALGGVASREERHPGGYIESSRASALFGSSDTGGGGPTNRSLLLRTGSANALHLVVEGRKWRVQEATECVDSDEILCDLEGIGSH